MRLISFLFLIFLIYGCKKDTSENPTAVDHFSNGLLVLNEGLFQHNNSSLSWINFSNDEVNNSLFEQKTNRQLGDTGNDIQRYGGKIYIVVNVSSTIEVLDAKSGASLAHIQMRHNGTPKQPRSIAFANGKGYVSCFDGFVDVMDTTSFSIVSRISVGLNPDHILHADGKIYVSNSGGLDQPLMDSTVSVIDPMTNAEVQKITVGKNPGPLSADNVGNIFVIARGNYSTIPSRLVKIEQGTNQTTTYSFNASNLSKMNDNFLVHSQAGSTSSVKLFNPSSGTIEHENYLDLVNVQTLFNIQYDPTRNQIYCFDAMNYSNSGYVRVFSSNGNYLKSYHVGLNPAKALIYE
jgi:YVTN family beta-propeller protein